jgi:outer membrane protein assembly factor BamD
MSRRIPAVVLLGVLAFTAACTNKKVVNPLASVGSKQPDKVLFDRAMDALKHNKFDVARLTLQTLINTYPDSEFIARAKLGVADSWYAEGGSTALAQAEIEYNDFKTFFPNMPEAAEAQLKIANIHYQQMEQPDRDYTHAMRAQEEYRNVILQFPDSKLVPVAKQRLMEVQEVLAEREFRVGRFYYLKQSFPAGIARLRSVVDQYPLYSKADEALYMLGQAYEGEINMTRGRNLNETIKARLIADCAKNAAEAYSRILTRYPLMNRADDAKARLEALHQPVPRPTKAAVALNKAEEDSRRETSMLTKVVRGFSKHPDVEHASRVGEPPLVDPEMVSATAIVQQATRAMIGDSAPGGKNEASVETVGTGAPPVGQEAPHSGAASPPALVADPAAPAAAAPSSAVPPSNELTPNATPDANELKPNASDDNGQTLPPPPQVNEIQAGGSSSSTASAGKSSDAASSDQQLADDAAISSSKHKKKKGLKKVIPF